MSNRTTYYCATINLNKSNIVRLHQKRTYSYLAEKYSIVISPNNKIYASDITDLLTNLNRVLRRLVIEFIEKKEVIRNKTAQVELARIIKEIRRIRRELRQEKLEITMTY